MISRLLPLGVALLAVPQLASAQTCSNPSSGPDVIVGSLNGISDWGGIGGTAAYSIGTTSCNLGDQDLLWISNTNQHPVIGQNIYRLHDGRFEQIGQGWLKHGFLALAQNLCCSCNNPGNFSLLGVGCSDPYGSGLNGDQTGLGPRSEVNPATGIFQYPFTTENQTGNAIYKRIQVAHSDLDSSSFPGALYYGDGQYVTPDDTAAGNGDNNVSYRRITVGTFTGNSWNLSMTGSTVREEPAINAWQAADAGVTLTPVDIVNDGRVIVGSNATDNGDGTWDYEYAVYNQTSDQAVSAFRVPLLSGNVITNVGFHDCDSHSGEPFSNTDWTDTVSATEVEWSTDPIGVNFNANAIRWGTLYNFRFTSNAAPINATVEITTFRGGAVIPVAAQVPGMAGPPQPPANNDCSSATVIAGTGTTAFNTANATSSGFNGGSCSSVNQDIFYQWTAPNDGDFSFDTCGAPYNSNLAVHLGSGCGATCADSNSNGCGNDGSITLVGLTAGQQVLIQIGGNNTATGTGTLTITEILPPPPANDNCATPSSISVGATAFDTSAATDSGFVGAVSGCAGAGVGVRDVFYQWIVPADGCYTIDTCAGASFDTALAVYAGAGCSSTCIGQDDDTCGTGSSVTVAGASAGDFVLIQVGGVGGAGGTGTLTITACPEPLPNDTCATPDVAALGTTFFNNDDATTSGFDGGNPLLCMSPANAQNTATGAAVNDLFWTFTIPCDGNYQFDTEGSTAIDDTRMSLHLGDDCSATCVAADDDGGANPDFSSLIVVSNANEGDTYLIQVGSWAPTTDTGDGQLNIARVGGPCPTNTVAIGCDPGNTHYQGNDAKMDGSAFGSGFQSGLHLDIVDGPSGEFGFILISADGSQTNPVFNGVLCLGSPAARYTVNVANNQNNANLNSIGQFDGAGVFQNLAGTATSTGGSGFDVPNALPFTPAGQSIQSGDTYYFQCWFRDQDGGGGSSANFSNMVIATWI